MQRRNLDVRKSEKYKGVIFKGAFIHKYQYTHVTYKSKLDFYSVCQIQSGQFFLKILRVFSEYMNLVFTNNVVKI